MKTPSSIDAIIEAMPRVQESVRREIRLRVAAGDEIFHARDGKFMVNDKVVLPLESAAKASPKRTQRRAA